ncbi:MAG: 23S rRNA (guanosine(2251)-2'-O)-methyltransferase RlmB [Bacteroidales bacterium]|nr:23S rRNA (guanosine(2251)-2'-O)-methyltransferase RlmB [Bacteroidales bacterium]
MENNTRDTNMIYGIHPVIEAIEAGKEIEKILVGKDVRNPQFMDLLKLIRQNNLPCQYVPLEKLNRVTRKNHQGIIAYIAPVTFHNIETIIPSLYEEGKNPLILILDKVTDVRNMGAILRTAECAGVDAVIYPEKGSAMLNSETVKSSAGAIEHIPICKVKNLIQTIKFLANSGLNIVACTEKTDTDFTEVDFTKPTAIIMGSEGEGISLEIFRYTHNEAAIPLYGKIESLNVSCATAVILYEVVKQRHKK